MYIAMFRDGDMSCLNTKEYIRITHIVRHYLQRVHNTQ